MDCGYSVPNLDLDAILATAPAGRGCSLEIGASREDHPIFGHQFGRGVLHVSLIGGCHADEPVGPAMLDRFAAYLAGLPADHWLVQCFRWRLVPHVNPDGEARNEAWTRRLGPPRAWGTEGHRHVDLPSYLRHVVREAPGDDVEFGFPRDQDDSEARPENRAVARFLRKGAEEHGPFALHASFHGMAFAAGPWFLLEEEWIERTRGLRNELRAQEGDWTFHDIDRGGDKGFHRIDRGFTTRPDSGAMRAHFLDRQDADTAARFRPSSMEYVRSLGGDPLTVVSEMPLFLVPAEAYRSGDLIRPAPVRELRALATTAPDDDEAILDQATRCGIRPMALDQQMRWQLRFLSASLRCVTSFLGGSAA